MSSTYDRISRDRGALERLIGKIPGYRGYKEKEMRREADQLLREALTRDFAAQLDRITPVQNRVLDTLGLTWMSDFGAVKTALQTLIDRIRFAPQGYAGFFDAIRVKEDDLDALEAFDLQLVDQLPRLSAAIDALNAAASDPAALKKALSDLAEVIQSISQLFAQRSKVITGL